ncbi:hypothetical protein J6590_042590, partial [Homalodisca vitripennis]
QNNATVLHGTDNKAMMWESTDQLTTGSRLTLGKPGDNKPKVADLPAVEGVGHMQRPKHPTSYAETLAHLLKGNIASGMYAMGDAFKNGGLLLAPFLTVFLGLICVFNQHILLLKRPLELPEHLSGEVQNPLDEWRRVTAIRRGGNGRTH